MKTLHIMRRRNDRLAEEVIRSEAGPQGKGGSVTVLLIQDAVLGSPEVPAPVYVNVQDLQARGAIRSYSSGEPRPGGSRRIVLEGEAGKGLLPHQGPQIIDYDQISRLILEHDRTVVW